MISVWDHIPSADELLDLRLSEGWTPTPSPLKDGDVVLGHAACLHSKPLDIDNESRA
jgi:hypothetical protein